jgi:hypothetical protein
MVRPTITYGTFEQPMHTNAQYLLMEASIWNGTYPTQEFIEAINRVSLRGIIKDECRGDLEIQKASLQSFAKLGDTITIKDYYPNRRKLEEFVNTTFSTMHARLTRESK